MKIIIDTREKYPWNLSFYHDNIQVRKLDYGDYSIEGLEDKIAIERKRSTGELAGNLGKLYRQFTNEMERMKDVEEKYVICEFSSYLLNVFPEKSGIPKYKWQYLKLTPKFLLSRIESIQEKYGVQFLFFDNSSEAAEHAYNLLSNIAEKYGKKDMAF